MFEIVLWRRINEPPVPGRSAVQIDSLTHRAANHARRQIGDFKADLIVNDELIIELKAVSSLVIEHEVQLVNYLTATGKDIGLLINFGGRSLEFKKKFRNPKPETFEFK